MRHRLLPGGKRRVDVERLHVAPGVFQRGQYEMGVLVDGAFPEDRITIGIVLDTPTDTNVNGYLCPKFSIQVYAEGCELNYRAPASATWFAYNISRQQLQLLATEVLGHTVNIPTTGLVNILPHSHSAKQLALIIALLFDCASATSGRNNQQLVDYLIEELHILLVCNLANNSDKKYLQPFKYISNRQRIISRAEEYLHANMQEPFSLHELARATETSERMLEYHFKYIYGVSPQIWFRSMKLNEIHREFKKLAGSHKRISDVAMEWGFNHLGRFSVEYRRLFGETPSMTLRNVNL
jgi:AraC-like DNA-binding protein